MGSKKQPQQSTPPKPKTPTFLLELPLEVQAAQVARVGAHLEVGRQFYNAVLSAGQNCLRRMRADPAWQAASAIPRTQKQERQAAFSALRERYGFSEYAFHELAQKLRVSWLAEHLDVVLAQTLASRAYRALKRVCVGKAHRVRFKSKSRGLSSIENKRNDTGMRFVLQTQDQGRPQGYLLWRDDRLRALVDWDDPVVAHGLAHPIKYARLVRRKAASPRAQGADAKGYRYFVQLVLDGKPVQKPEHKVGSATIGLDLGPASIAIVPRQAEAKLVPLCAELAPAARAIRRLQRKMDRQRRAANPEHYDEKGRPKKRGKGAPRWNESQSYKATRRRKAARERRLAAQRKSLQGRMVHQIIHVGNAVITEKISYKGWQKRYGKSVGHCAPGMLIDHLKRAVAKTGGTLHEVPTRTAKLSQYCHGCGTFVPKPLSQRLHRCLCGIGPVQRDLYSAFLAAHLDPADPIPSCARYVIRLLKVRRRACGQHTSKLHNARMRGRSCPEALASPEPERVCPKVGAKRHQSCFSSPREGRWKRGSTAQNPPCFSRGSRQIKTSTSIIHP